MKTCTQCGVEKPLEDFYRVSPRRRKPNGDYFTECKSCNIARASAWAKVKQESDPDYRRRRFIWQRYKLTMEQYQDVLAAQGNACAICGSTDPQTGKSDLFPVDHDHETGAVRGLICQPCNTGLGGFKDDVDRLMAAAAYLLAHQDVLIAVNF